ncbi:DUF1232 domain-containing protein [Flavobacteriaceae bacterium TK19130]|nr:DUF1232 domain-containing protein [Thermobacterium salinum]
MLFNKKKKKPTDSGSTSSQSNIALMNEGFTEDNIKENVDKINDDDVEIVMENEEEIARKLSNASPLRKYAELGKIMLSMLKDVRSGSYPSVPWFTIASIALALLYVLNPMDVIPDFIPGLGYIDDLAVLSIGMGWIESDLHKYLDWRLQRAEAATES